MFPRAACSLAVLALTTACGSTPTPHPGPTPTAEPTVVPATSAVPVGAAKDAAPQPTAGLPADKPPAATGPLKPHPVPDGVTCTIAGTGAPFPDPCNSPSVPAFSERTGGAPVARFSAEQVNVTWGFFDGKGRAFVAIDDGGLELRAFTDASPVTFQLIRDVEVVAGHVWLAADAPVRVKRASNTGSLQVTVVEDMPGVAEIPSTVACRDVRFEHVVAASPVPAATESPQVLRNVTAKGDVLRLLAAPGGKTVATLRSSDDFSFPFLSALADERGYTRVAFETKHARFDAWVAASQLGEGATGIGLRGIGACGGGRDDIKRRMPTLKQDTPIRAGATPKGEPAKGLTAVAGTPVIIDEERDGFAAVTIVSEIAPLEGQKFWVPLGAIEGR